MLNLLKSGDFAKLCGTTKNTLIHYDQIGILQPASLDPNTGYRYYSYSQWNRFVAIKALTDAGFSLKDVAKLLDGRNLIALSNAAEEGRHALNARILELEDSLSRIRAIQEQLFEATMAPLDKPEIVIMPTQYYYTVAQPEQPISVVEYTESASIQQQNMDAINHLQSSSPSAGMAPYGLIARGPLDECPVKYDTYFYLITNERDARLVGNVKAIPGGRYARLAFKLPWEDITPAHKRLMEFVEENGGDINAPRYEVSAFRLFDSNSNEGFDIYHGIVFMPL